MMRLCAVIPVYNHPHVVGAVVAAVLAQDLTCILVDDGSDPACASTLDAIAATSPTRVILLRHAQNRGKGAAVLTGMRHAITAGYTHALQIDADGQHDTGDIARFAGLSAHAPQAIICGCPVYDASVPKVRLYARYLTHVWVWINTLSLTIRDSMCGFRLYPLDALERLLARRQIGTHMQFDTEVLVRLYWAGVPVINLPTRVTYPRDGVSHFRAVRDNVAISAMHARLFAGMLPRLPQLVLRKLAAARKRRRA